MILYLKLLGVAMVPVVISIIFYALEQRSGFAKLSYRTKQIIIGFFFGLAAVFGTECGVNTGTAVINARDAAPLCAGLIFGGPAGIIAGVIGGVERWFAVYWGAGMYSRLACSVSTILAGLYAAALRRFMFDNKRPTPSISFIIAIVMEVLHLSILFLTHPSDSEAAYELVKVCTFPMLLCNAAGVYLAVLFFDLSSRKQSGSMAQPVRTIAQRIQLWMLLAVIIGYLITTVFVYILQTNSALSSASELMLVNLGDVYADLKENADSRLITRCRNVVKQLEKDPDVDLDRMLDSFGVAEINIVSPKGIITRSTNPENIGFDMDSNAQSREFLALNQGEESVVQEIQPVTISGSSEPVYMKYAGCTLSDGGFVLVGYGEKLFLADVAPKVKNMTNNRHVGKDGTILIADRDGDIVSTNSEAFFGSLDYCGIHITESTAPGELQSTLFNGENYYWTYVSAENYHIIAVVPKSQVMKSRDEAVYINSYMQVIVFAALFYLIYMLIKWLVVNNIRKVNANLEQIIHGNLSVTVDVHSSTEFASLSNDINSTVTTLKQLIAETAARIDKDLALAKSIQLSALPDAQHALSNARQVDAAAFMGTAKEVGGDFYDVYLLGRDKVAVLIADVSGKGIPAAMFMMQAKAIIKNHAEKGLPVNDVFSLANERLCESNDAGMFVTAWMGILDLRTGHMTYANAGHNPPVIMRKDRAPEYLQCRPGFILAGMDGVNYKLQELDLAPGDRIFLYTDGVTEATDLNETLYGEDRLLKFLTDNSGLDTEKTLLAVKQDIDEFVGEAEQFDDITMVDLQYNGWVE